MSQVMVAESITSGSNSGHGAPFRPAGGIPHNVFVTAISGALIAERSYDGTNWWPVDVDSSGTNASWSDTGSFIITEPEDGILWRFTTAGSATYRISR